MITRESKDFIVIDKYDSVIEKVFFQKLELDILSDKLKELIKVSWLKDKILYSNLSSKTQLEFLHYSMHDESHSISILQNIYRFLGDEAVNKLSVGDLWLLLECAYSHDIGMSTDYDELKELWKNAKEIKNIISYLCKNDYEAFAIYNAVLNYLNSKNDDSDEETRNFIENNDCWPLEFRKSIAYINSEYLRRNHPERSKNKVIELMTKCNQLQIEERLYKLVGIIDWLHGEDFSKISKKLPYKILGFDVEEMHPQFIACLLRIGDVLDIRNNRFDYWNINYLCGLPQTSELHLKKHKSVETFLISPTQIYILINCEEMDVAKNSRNWLNLVDNESVAMVKEWNKVAPSDLGGAKLQELKLIVKFNSLEFENSKYISTIKADPNKILQLLSGKNVYQNKLVLFRELLQNAVDATKMRIAKNIYENDKFLYKAELSSYSEVLPSHIPENEFLDKPIEIIMSYGDEEGSIISFKIKDSGIGMDEDGLDSLFKIGTGWSNRKNVEDLFEVMPAWILPTGGFGIGVLSVFLLCDQIKVETKSKRTPKFNLSIKSPKQGGTIEKTIQSNYFGDTGTVFSFDIEINALKKELEQYLEENYKNNKPIEYSVFKNFISKYNFFKKEDRLFILSQAIKIFVEELIVDTIVPIKISYNNYMLEFDVKHHMIYESDHKQNEFNNFYHFDYINGIDFCKNNFFIYSGDLLKNQSYIKIRYRSPEQIKLNKKTNFGYKGFIINHENVEAFCKNRNSIDLLQLCDMYVESIDIFQKNVSQVLLISRDNFTNSFRLEDLIDEVLEEILYRLLSVINNDYKSDDLRIISDNVANYQALVLYCWSHNKMNDKINLSDFHFSKFIYEDIEKIHIFHSDQFISSLIRNDIMPFMRCANFYKLSLNENKITLSTEEYKIILDQYINVLHTLNLFEDEINNVNKKLIPYKGKLKNELKNKINFLKGFINNFKDNKLIFENYYNSMQTAHSSEDIETVKNIFIKFYDKLSKKYFSNTSDNIFDDIYYEQESIVEILLEKKVAYCLFDNISNKNMELNENILEGQKFFLLRAGSLGKESVESENDNVRIKDNILNQLYPLKVNEEIFHFKYLNVEYEAMKLTIGDNSNQSNLYAKKNNEKSEKNFKEFIDKVVLKDYVNVSELIKYNFEKYLDLQIKPTLMINSEERDGNIVISPFSCLENNNDFEILKQLLLPESKDSNSKLNKDIIDNENNKNKIYFKNELLESQMFKMVVEYTYHNQSKKISTQKIKQLYLDFFEKIMDILKDKVFDNLD